MALQKLKVSITDFIVENPDAEKQDLLNHIFQYIDADYKTYQSNKANDLPSDLESTVAPTSRRSSCSSFAPAPIFFGAVLELAPNRSELLQEHLRLVSNTPFNQI
jgi:hypothetical protein